MKKKILRWSNHHIIIPRWLLVIKYGFFFIVGITILATSTPSFQAAINESDVINFVFGTGIAASSISCLVGCVNQKLEPAERYGLLLLVSLLLGFAVAPFLLVLDGLINHLVFSEIALLVSLLPLARFLGLAKGSGVKHE